MNVIPQIFYDLIARIIPATCILIFKALTIIFFNKENGELIISFFGRKDFNVGNYLNLWTTLYVVIVAYLLSLILKLPSEWTSELKLWRKLFFVKEQTIDSERYLKEKESFGNQSVKIPEPWKLFSIVRVKLPDEGYRLLKMLAEIRLCEMMFFAFIILAVVNIILLFFSSSNLSVRIIAIIFFLFSSRSLLQLKYSIKNSYEKGLLMAWEQIGENTPIDNA